MRKTCLEYVYEMAKKDERIVFIGSDLGFKTLEKFRQEMPDRFFMEGIAEQNLVGMAAGMAMEGRIVYINTIAPFLTRRCYDQLMINVAMHNLPVRLIANGGGLVYAPLGVTHLAFEDISIVRAIPNMTIVSPADANEMARFMPQSVDWEGPIYIRLAKGTTDPIVTPDDEDFQIGKAATIKKGNDVLLVTTGITLKIALEASEKLMADHVDAEILHFHTVKPFDNEVLLEAAKRIKTIVVIEENTLQGGLGELVGTILLENGVGDVKFRRVGIPDIFPDEYGSQNSLMSRCGVDAEHVVAAVKS